MYLLTIEVFRSSFGHLTVTKPGQDPYLGRAMGGSTGDTKSHVCAKAGTQGALSYIRYLSTSSSYFL
jgi:hypothetical protein